MSEESGVVELLLANDHGVDFPIWGPEGLLGAEGLDLSPELVEDLAEFAQRWDDWLTEHHPEIFDDRFDGTPQGRVLDEMYERRRSMNPDWPRLAEAHDLEMRRIGESLRERLEIELGQLHRVTYRH